MKSKVYFTLLLVIALCFTGAGSAGAWFSEDAAAEPALDLSASAEQLLIGIETASNITRQIQVVDSPGQGDYLAVLTDRYGDRTNNTSKYNVAVQVDSSFTVTQIANKAPAPGVAPIWQDSPNLEIPRGGFVLLAVDDSYQQKGFKKFAAENFEIGDKVKLKLDGQAVSMAEFKERTEELAQPSTLVLDQDAMFTVPKEQSRTVISGKLTNYDKEGPYRILIANQPVSIQNDGAFAHEVDLEPQTNYIEVKVQRGEVVQNRFSVVVYRYMKLQEGREVYLWIEQSTNLNKYPTSEAIRRMLVKAKDAGVTAVSFPVKGHEGFASYLQNDLSGIPHISQITEPSKQGVPEDMDVLQYYIDHSRELGLRIDAVFNLYGSGTARDTGLTPEQFDDFEEWVYRPEDGGQIVPIRQSRYKPSVYFMNPANERAQQYQMKVIEEVMRNYDVDGVVLDRARYDNLYADFSPISRLQFENYLAGKGKSLARWPQDIMEHLYDEQGTYLQTERGPLFYDWLTYRSTVSKQFFTKLRERIDQVNAETGKQIPFAISLGSWYSSYYEVGQNWANPNVPYDARLGLPLADLYTEEYAQTGFGTRDIFDYMILGTYYNTPSAVKRGITMIHTLLEEEFPVYAGFQLQQLPDPEDQRQSFQAALQFTNGIKLFDLSVINWDIQKAALEDRPYVKPYQLGLSLPDNLTLPEHLQPLVANGFIEADYYNQNRAVGTMAVYSDLFGPTTGTSGSYGVEVIVGSDGNVRDVVNKQQAMNWNWSGNRPNNSAIPQGGFVVSALDNDGVRTLRQLLAYSYSLDDDVRAAALRGHLDYDGVTISESVLEMKGNVEVFGPGRAQTQVTLNGTPAAIDDQGDFVGRVDLQPGPNTIEINVWVDGRKTNSKTVKVTRETAELTGLEFEQAEYVLRAGDSIKPKLTAVYSDGSRREAGAGVEYHSSQPNVVSIAVDGTLTGLNEGTSVVTAVYGSQTARTQVNVIPRAQLQRIEVDEGDYSLIVGQTHQTEVFAVYEDGTRERVTGAVYRSSHERVAEVTEAGLVTALKPGRADITVEYEGKKAKIRVKVFNNDNGKGKNK
ncbi:family 10 glycosylhydrolase [Paenibacillus sp. J2TS4]|uniref:family 10 glycosylhydrolase n=1 Tax=Paenibacillus sp. J2TS4 TaxID=2807194 RepID=UPI001B13520C|nr:family 10 glycosylhydrolase [Paenibacillus sp. J2TS4]GIP35677.1 hypothetical protein J2TS4_48870 [Paenibacillus sp. J2TS4]